MARLQSLLRGSSVNATLGPSLSRASRKKTATGIRRRKETVQKTQTSQKSDFLRKEEKRNNRLRQIHSEEDSSSEEAGSVIGEKRVNSSKELGERDEEEENTQSGEEQGTTVTSEKQPSQRAIQDAKRVQRNLGGSYQRMYRTADTVQPRDSPADRLKSLPACPASTH